MLTDNQQKFIDNLLSGEFVQGRGMLRNNQNEYCCLGVACETYRRETGNGSWISQTGHYFFAISGKEDDKVRLYMPVEVSVWLGLPASCSDPKIAGLSATYVNDNRWTFEQIAETFKTYFERENSKC